LAAILAIFSLAKYPTAAIKATPATLPTTIPAIAPPDKPPLSSTVIEPPPETKD